MTNYFTGDEHFDDEGGILRYCNRPFDNGTHMINDIINRHNEVVKSGDTVHHIGDFFFKDPADISLISSIVRALNGTHILILGNHDKTDPFKLVNAGFRSVHTSLELVIDGHKVVCVHDSSAWTVVSSDVIFLHGHIHKLYQSIPPQKVVNVGVDVWDYYPVSFEQILKTLQNPSKITFNK